MAKLTLADIGNITGSESGAISDINNNSQAIEDAIENTLSRDGTSPNSMNADLDMNNFDILNVEALDVVSFTLNGETVVTPLTSKGDTGDAATITVGTVTTGAAGTNVIITNVGDENDAVFNFTIPRGDTGAAGAGTGDMLAAQNLADVASASTAFANIKQAASDTATGVVELATDAETQTGTDTARAITPANLTAKEATTANYRANTADRILTTDQVWDAADCVALTDAATITVDFSAGFNFGAAGNGFCGLNGNRTLGAPSNVDKNQSGVLWFIGVGSTRTLTLHADWIVASGVETGPYSITTSQGLGVAYIVKGSQTFVTAILRIG